MKRFQSKKQKSEAPLRFQAFHSKYVGCFYRLNFQKFLTFTFDQKTWRSCSIFRLNIFSNEMKQRLNGDFHELIYTVLLSLC